MSAGISQPDLFLKALIVLPEIAVVGFQAQEGLLFVKDDYANAAVSHLIHVGIRAQIVEEKRT